MTRSVQKVDGWLSVRDCDPRGHTTVTHNMSICTKLISNKRGFVTTGECVDCRSRRGRDIKPDRIAAAKETEIKELEESECIVKLQL